MALEKVVNFNMKKITEEKCDATSVNSSTRIQLKSYRLSRTKAEYLKTVQRKTEAYHLLSLLEKVLMSIGTKYLYQKWLNIMPNAPHTKTLTRCLISLIEVTDAI